VIFILARPSGQHGSRAVSLGLWRAWRDWANFDTSFQQILGMESEILWKSVFILARPSGWPGSRAVSLGLWRVWRHVILSNYRYGVINLVGIWNYAYFSWLTSAFTDNVKWLRWIIFPLSEFFQDFDPGHWPLGSYHVQAIVAMLEKIYRSDKLPLICTVSCATIIVLT
jgi:hypothetical protein